jgi:hypothetical protein
VKTTESSLTVLEFVNNIFGIMNVILGWVILQNYKTWVGIIILTSGVLYIVLFFLNQLISREIKISIIDKKHDYQRQRSSVIIDKEDEQKWMFFELSKEYPNLSTKKLKARINKYYESH